jgi:hypothetical protein
LAKEEEQGKKGGPGSAKSFFACGKIPVPNIFFRSLNELPQEGNSFNQKGKILSEQILVLPSYKGTYGISRSGVKTLPFIPHLNNIFLKNSV